MHKKTLVLRSFGFKYGNAPQAMLMVDVRFLPNPFWIDGLKPLSGLDPSTQEYFEYQIEVQTFIQGLVDYIVLSLSLFKKNLKEEIIIAIGCTGGQHRSVYVVETLAKKLSAILESSFNIYTEHREQAHWM